MTSAAIRVACATALAASLATSLPVRAQAPLKLQAFAVSMGTIGTGANATVYITIDTWSPVEQRDALLGILKAKGPDKMLSALQKAPKVGWIRFPKTLSYDLHYARETPGEDGGRRIVIATDRRISMAEARNGGRSMDYPFTLIEIHLGRDGTGEGKMATATKISYNKEGSLVLENYSSEPVRLMQVEPVS
jgi:hypothetical protein